MTDDLALLVRHASKLRKEVDELWLRRVWKAFWTGTAFGAIGLWVLQSISIVH